MGLTTADAISSTRGTFADASSTKELYWSCDDSGAVFIEGSRRESMGSSTTAGKTQLPRRVWWFERDEVELRKDD